jgi:hypothetical protein
LTQQAQADQEHVRKSNFQKITGKRKTERFQDIMLFHSFLFIAHHRLSHSQHIYISERSTNMAHFRDPFFVLFFSPFASCPTVSLVYIKLQNTLDFNICLTTTTMIQIHQGRASLIRPPWDKTKNFFLVIFSMR